MRTINLDVALTIDGGDEEGELPVKTIIEAVRALLEGKAIGVGAGLVIDNAQVEQWPGDRIGN